MTQKRRLDAMLSSTSKDLPDHREKAEDASNRSGFYVVKMENLTATPDDDAISISMKMVEEAEVYVGIFGMRYGYRPEDAERNPDGISVTEMEYRRAKELGMPILIFIMSDDHLPPDLSGKNAIEAKKVMDNFYEGDPIGEKKLEDFKSELGLNHIVGFFDSADDLRTKVLQALSTSTLKDKANQYFESRESSTDGSVTPQKESAQKSSIPQPPELYAYPPYSGQSALFVGRHDELQMLDEWSQGDTEYPMLVLEAIGGMGKSALTWKWIQDRAVEFDGIFWYSFYEGGALMDEFVIHALAYVTGRDPADLQKMRFTNVLSELVTALQNGRYLLVLDGMERILVAYHHWNAAQMRDDMIQDERVYRACTNPRDMYVLRQLTRVAPSNILITSRLMPAALEDFGVVLRGVQHEELKGLSHDDAQNLWRTRGITWKDDNKLRQFMDQFGRHSLLLKLLIDVITKNRRMKNNFDTWHKRYGNRIDGLKEMQAKRASILQFAYEGLSEEAKKLLSQMATLGTGMDIDTLNVFNPYKDLSDDDAVMKFDELLQDLEQRGLIWWDERYHQYDLHPVVRAYASSQLADKDRSGTFDQIYNYFEGQEKGDEEEYTTFKDMENIIAMYNALIGAGKFETAGELFRDRMRRSLVIGGLGLYQKAHEMLMGLFPYGLEYDSTLLDSVTKSFLLFDMGHILDQLRKYDDAELAHSSAISVRINMNKLIWFGQFLNGIIFTFANNNKLNQALRVYELSLLTAKDDDLYYDENYIYANTILGRYEENLQYYRDRQIHSVFRIQNMISFAKSLLWQGQDRDKIHEVLNKVHELSETRNVTQGKRLYSSMLGQLAMREGDIDDAITHFTEAARIGNEQGVRDPDDWSGLARAHAAKGNLKQALRIINDGVDDHGFAATVVHLADQNIDEARKSALEFYTWSWAQGEPYVRRWELEQARKLLAELNEPEPQLPVWDDSMYVPFPGEEEVIKYIEKKTGEKVEFK